MPSVTVPPSTLDGIKRLAKTLKRERAIPHHQALEAAARIAGYENMRHAQRMLEGIIRPTLLHPVFLSAFWREDNRSGRETLRIELPKPLTEIARRAQLKQVRELGHFRLDAEDHLERRLDLRGRGEAHLGLFAAARALRFMAATGLVPVTTQQQMRKLRFLQDMPGHDHSSRWQDPVSLSWIYLDEPYDHHGPELLDVRKAWLRTSELHAVAPEWEGLYAPGMSRPYLVSPDATLLGRIVRHVAALPAEASPQEWEGESGRYTTPFVSPARQSTGFKPRRRPMPAYKGEVRNGSTPYGIRIGGAASRWRPAVAMPLDVHLQVGPLLHGVCNARLPARVHDALNMVRSELDNWVQAEYPGDAMSQEQFLAMYYGSAVVPIEGRENQTAALRQAKAMLSRGYADCSPRRELLKTLKKVESGLTTTGTGSPA